jgi:hypothetical protein
MGWIAEKLEFDSWELQDFLFSIASSLVLVPSQPVLYLYVLGALFLVIKWAGHENDHISV